MGNDEIMKKDIERIDAVIVGAGWAGMYMAHRLRALGMNVRIYEAGAGVGGTWYWNRYPGARCDIPSLNYSYSSPLLYKDWIWSERYAAQPEIERYANYAADKFGIRDAIAFNTTVEKMRYDEAANTWRVTTEDGKAVDAQWVFMAVGGYSAPAKPKIPGIDEFTGELNFTQRWPEHDVDFKGKRIGVIGTGSSGIQAITTIGQRGGFAKLSVLQRTANFAVPSVNHPIDAPYQAEFKRTHGAFWKKVLESGSGTFHELPPVKAATMPEDEFQAYMAQSWAIGGPGVTAGISDLMTSKEANERVSEYIRAKIRARVKDPRVAELLCPRGFFIGARRVACETGYYEVFNDPKVELIDVKSDRIARMTQTAIVTESGREIELDMLVLATGFDSGTGAWLKVDIAGRGGVTLAQAWADGPATYLGLSVAGFPNLFSLAGPGSPSIRGNVLVSIEQHVDWLADMLRYAQDRGVDRVEATADAQESWSAHVAGVANATLLAHDDTQYVGANIPGKPRVYLAYTGGIPVYRMVCDAVRTNGYEGLVLAKAGEKVNLGAATWSGLPKEAAPRLRFGATVI